MLVVGKPLLVGLAGGAVAEALEEPLLVVELDEGRDGVADLVDVAVRPCPEALFLEGLDPPFGAAVTFGLAGKGGRVLEPEPCQGAGEVRGAVLAAPVMADLDPARDVRGERSPPIEDRVLDRL